MDVNSSHWQADAKRAQQKGKVLSGMGSRRSLASLAANADPPAEPEPSPGHPPQGARGAAAGPVLDGRALADGRDGKDSDRRRKIELRTARGTDACWAG